MNDFLKRVRPYLKPLRNYARHIYRVGEQVIDRQKPYIRHKKYHNFTLYYSRGTTLLDKSIFGSVYEAENSRIIAEELKSQVKPVFVDVGANIGLITLNVLAEIPEVRIYAFEPGKHQYSLLQRTLQANSLRPQVSLYKEALSFEVGEASFAIHASKDASGDGLRDTKRAGKARTVIVPLQTLDAWWKEANHPSVTVMKIDTEGAELWVLQGGESFFEQCKPTLILEIWPEHIQAYPYSVEDLLSWLSQHGYTVLTVEGIPVTPENRDQFMGVEATFIARASA